MSETVIRIEGLCKQYRYGVVSHHYFVNDLQSWWARIRNKEDPNTKVAVGPQTSVENPIDSFWALQDINLEIKQGEVVGIIGRNGAGKSTLLKVLSRVTAPTKGSIKIRGRIGSLLEVGTGFHPELTGRENVFLNGAILGMRKNEIGKKFDEIVNFAEVEKFIDTPVKRYSSGMYVRLAFAVAAHLDPEILVVDEVLAVGDAEFQRKCLGKMGEISKNDGRTVLFVSHNMASIQQLCKSAILLNKGGIERVGTTSEVTEHYLKVGVVESLSWVSEKGTNTEIYFRSINFLDEHGEEIHYVTTSNAVIVEMEYAVLKRARDLQLSIDLLDWSGNVIFASSPTDFKVPIPNEPGNYRAVFKLPGQILLGRNYGIRATLWQPSFGVFDRVDTIRFTAHETNTCVNTVLLSRPGLIGIKCEWTIKAQKQITNK